MRSVLVFFRNFVCEGKRVMSLILQRKSKGLEPVLPTVSVTVGVLPNDDGLGDQRHFMKVLPKHWNKRQVAQLFLFLFGCLNINIASTVLNKQARVFIQLNGFTENRVDIVAAGALLFGFEGALAIFISLFIFPTFLALIEREVNPFRALSACLTYTVMFVSVAVFYGETSRLAISNLAFLCLLAPLLNLVTEHCLFYAKSLARLNSRQAPKLELALPYALSFCTMAFATLSPSYYITTNLTLDKKPVSDGVTMITMAAFAAQLAIGAWVFVPKRMSYVRLELVTYALALFSKAVFVQAFTRLATPMQLQHAELKVP